MVPYSWALSTPTHILHVKYTIYLKHRKAQHLRRTLTSDGQILEPLRVQLWSCLIMDIRLEGTEVLSRLTSMIRQVQPKHSHFETCT